MIPAKFSLMTLVFFLLFPAEDDKEGWVVWRKKHNDYGIKLEETTKKRKAAAQRYNDSYSKLCGAAEERGGKKVVAVRKFISKH